MGLFSLCRCVRLDVKSLLLVIVPNGKQALGFEIKLWRVVVQTVNYLPNQLAEIHVPAWPIRFQLAQMMLMQTHERPKHRSWGAAGSSEVAFTDGTIDVTLGLVLQL